MKKFLAILISAVLLIGLLPMTVFADDDAAAVTQELEFPGVTITSVDRGNVKLDVTYSLSEGDALIAGKTNYVTISVHNRGRVLKDVDITLATHDAGITIQSGSIKRSIDYVLTGETENVIFPISCSGEVLEGSYSFDIVISAKISKYDQALKNLLPFPVPDDETGEYTQIQIAGYVLGLLDTFGFESMTTPLTDTFYVPVKLTEGKGSYTTPRLMLTNYNCGGSVLAGSTFGLGLTFRNTSQEDLYNIKATIVTSNFVPVGSSNSFFIDCIKAGESVSKTVTLSCARDLAQQQYAVGIKTEYEDASGKSQSGDDQISIPVMQEMRLVVDDILDPGWLTMSDTGYANVNYRNMGNNTINNLTIKVEGDFDIEGSNIYYVGNLASGKSDNYSFSFYPHAEGNCKGTVTFTYEDAEGYEHHIDKVFNFNIGPAYSWDDPGDWEDMPVENPGLPTWAKIAIPVAAVVAIIVVISLLKKHKAKKQEALDLDE